MALQIDLLALLLDIVMDGCRADHCRNRVARACLRGTGHPAAEGKRHLSREPKARRNSRAQPVVPALAAIRDLLPPLSGLQPGTIQKLEARTKL